MTTRWLLEVEVDPAPQGPIKLSLSHTIVDPRLSREADIVSWAARAALKTLGVRVGGTLIGDELVDRLARCGVRVRVVKQ